MYLRVLPKLDVGYTAGSAAQRLRRPRRLQGLRAETHQLDIDFKGPYGQLMDSTCRIRAAGLGPLSALHSLPKCLSVFPWRISLQLLTCTHVHNREQKHLC